MITINQYEKILYHRAVSLNFNIPDKHRGEVLMSCTSYPFADYKTVERELAESSRASGGDWELAVKKANKGKNHD